MDFSYMLIIMGILGLLALAVGIHQLRYQHIWIPPKRQLPLAYQDVMIELRKTGEQLAATYSPTGTWYSIQDGTRFVTHDVLRWRRIDS